MARIPWAGNQPTEHQKRRARRVVVLLAGIVILSLADLVLTISMLQGVGMAEQNPIADWLIRETGSTRWLTGFKLLSVGLSAMLLFASRHYRVAEVAGWSGLALMIGLSVHWYHFVGEVAATDPQMLVQGDQVLEGWIVLE